ncbi:polysaccharide deacetylase family protein [Clostridium sp. AM58-1XD]|uniref:polysaccharide deacetylase family protein n=1 Tax=Clostridium sp. AM58-1XD TaxID=2292307 RepID=UPI001FA917B6|nr:polysaccharide deacetylase family protein [Clostridium sp. AM58-1XD]
MKKLWTVCIVAALCAVPQTTVMAASGRIAYEWTNTDQGPGVATWVDENGNEAEPPAQENTEEKTAAGPGEAIDNGGAQEHTNEESGQSGQTQNAAEESAATGEDGEQAEDSQAQGSQSTDENTSGNTAGNDQEDGGTQETGRRIDPSKPMVALTFDDGPYAPVGNQIMDCLAQYGGKATFYVVGNRCRTYSAEMKRMAAEGHEIGNHTYEHKLLNKLNSAQIREQIDRGAAAIQEVSGVRPATVRLPGGNKNAMVLAAVQEPIVLWSMDTLDWKTRNTAQTVNKVLGTIKDGDIVLMHELYTATGNAALQIIPELHRRGIQMVTVSEMAQYRGGLQNGRVYSSMR